MSSEIAIQVENLSKCYQIYEQPHDRLKQFVMPQLQRIFGQQPRQYYREFWALEDVSFEVKKGETVGIIGRNGSGKSTLLQMICGTLNPSSGNVQTHGRIAALLELGSGFNPEFSGRENIYMNGAVLGLTKEQIDNRFDDIAAFADIGNFIEQPVKAYSSGMMVRLAFAVAIKVDPAILIVDEALAVGDMNFQAKCMTAISRIQNNGATVLFVSHDVGAVKSLCKQAVYLERGKVRSIGSAPEVAEQYIRTMREEMSADVRQFARVATGFSKQQQATSESLLKNIESNSIFKHSDEFDRRVATHRYGSGGAKITYVELLNVDRHAIQVVTFNEKVSIRIYVVAETDLQISVSFNVKDEKGINIVGCGFSQVSQEFVNVEAGRKYSVEYSLHLPLQEGRYSISSHISSSIVRGQSAEFVDVVEDAVVFQVGRWSNATIWSKVHLFPTLEFKEF